MFNRNEAVFVSLDVETAGEEVGVAQLSAEIFRLNCIPTKNKKGKNKEKINIGADTATHIRRDPEVFKKYIKPEGNAEWCPRSVQVHHLTASHPSIVDTDNIHKVWGRFVDWTNRKVGVDETGILVAYHGEACNLKRIWRLTQAPGSSLAMPDKMKLFLDPELIMWSKKLCKLHPSKSKTAGTALSTVWSYIHTNGLLDDQHWHASLVNVRAQTGIVVAPRFVPWINRDTTILTINKTCADAVTREWKKRVEPIRPVHAR